MKKITLITTVFGVILVVMFPGCQQDITLTIKTEKAVSGTVSFGKDLQPIFSKSCALGGCHADGGHLPDLMAGKAYNSLITGKYVDTTTPKMSIIYERLTGVLSPAMPLTGSSNPSNIEGLMLAWVTQGAKNN